MRGLFAVRESSITPSARRVSALRILAYCLVLAMPTPSARAINIVIQLQDEGENPSYDSNGAQLEALFEAAATYWEDYLPASDTYEVDVMWSASEFSDDPGVLGRWSFQVGGDNNIRINPNPTADGDPAQWYFDPTPLDHSEYDFDTQDRNFNDNSNRWDYRGGQWLYRDIDPGEQSSWFGGSPPSVMEVGYRGRAVDPTIAGQYDLLSTVIHELGHELGVNNTGGPWSPDSVWVPTGSAVFEEDSGGHIAARTSLMCTGCGMLGTRRMPSAVDIMAVADDENFGVVDLPRQDYAGSGEWHTVFHWMEGLPPDGADDAYLRDNNVVLLTANADVNNLWVSNGSSLFAQAGNQLQVFDSLTVSQAGGSSTLLVGANAAVFADTLTLAGSDLQLLDGTVTAYGDLVLTEDGVSGGQISAYGGEVRVGGALYNEGEIIAFGGVTTFTHTGNPTATLDLDGLTQEGFIRAHLGDLVFDAETTDAFDGDMEVFEDRTITMNHDWALGAGGLLKFFVLDSNPGPATLAGPAKTTIQGMVTVSGLPTSDTAIGVLATDEAWFESSAIVQVGANDRLVLDTDAFYRGGIHTGMGAIEQQGDVQVWEDTDILAEEFDWGNSTPGEVHQTFINETVTFAIKSSTTGTPSNEYRGVMTVTGGVLDVALDSGWLLPRRDGEGALPAGTLNLNRGDANAAVVTGVPLTVEGFVRANGGLSLMEADFITRPTADIRVAAASELLLQGQNTYDGGQLYGDGEIGQWGATTVISDTAVSTQYYDLDGDESAPSTTTIQPGVTFAVNSQRIDKSGESFDGTIDIEGGTLEINTPGSWTIGANGQLNLMNSGGPAWLLGADVEVHGSIEVTGGNEVFPAVAFQPSSVVFATQPTDILRLRGHTDYEGGAYAGGGGIIQDATAFVNAETAIGLGFFDMDGVSETTFIELHDDLFLNVDRIDMNDNRFNGVLSVTDSAQLGVNTPERWVMAGSLVVAGAAGTTFTLSGAEAHIASDASVLPDNTIVFESDVSGPGNFTGGGDVVFAADYSPGASPASVTFDGDVSLADTAQLWLELGGATPGSQHDQLVTLGDAVVGGVLQVSLIAGASGEVFLPQVGDVFDLVKAAQTLTGEFSEVHLPEQLGGIGFDWDLAYESETVRLELVDAFSVALPGDYNNDGVVDAGDYVTWRDTLGSTSQLAADGDGSGVVDAADYAWWRSHYGATDAAAGAAAPEPAGAVLLLMASVLVGAASTRTPSATPRPLPNARPKRS